MTLKEKIEYQVAECPLEHNPTKRDLENYFLGINKLEQTAEEFAIEFSKFIEIECVKTEYLHQYTHNGKEYNIKALLQKFKEQKGL